VPARATASLLASGLVAALIAWGVARASTIHARGAYDARAARGTSAVRLAGADAEYVFQPTTGHVSARTRDGAASRDVDVSIVVDGQARPLALEHGADRATDRNAFGAWFGVAVGDDTYDALVTLHVDAATSALAADLMVVPDRAVGPHTFALRFEAPTDGRAAFVSGVGELGDLGVIESSSSAAGARARAVEIDAEPRAMAIVPASGALEVAGVADTTSDLRGAMRVTATTAPERLPQADASRPAQAGLRLVFAKNNRTIWRALYTLAGDPASRVRGVVTGAEVTTGATHARVYGLDSEGLPRVRASVDAAGRFELDVPKSVTLWYASVDPERTSTPVTFEPGTPWDLRLDVSPGGEVSVRVLDGDTHEPLTARLLVHGLDSTLDPSFGPDYRASGAGPIVDALRGAITTPLPAGRYRVAATKGPEWSIDAKTVDVVTGRSAQVDLALRHVVPTPGLVGCDLHVHARPSFDTPVLPEDRVLSLVSAGIDFAVPSEHNIVGDYTDALASLDLARDLAQVTGVEITTFAPRFGHFGLFPYPLGKPPPFKGTNLTRVFDFVHAHAPANAVFQVNHPRLGGGIGYFDVVRFDPKKPLPAGMRTDFDTIEVYNGYESRTPERVERVMNDWFALLNEGHRYAATGSSDSHRIQYQWAGYPRTMAIVGEDRAGDRGAPVDTSAVVAAIKKGRSFVTSGPMIDLAVGDARPGDEITTEDPTVRAHVVVRAAPWIDVSQLEVVVGGKTTDTVAIPSRSLALGPELGTLDECQSRTLRYEGDLTIPVGPESTWVIVVVRGARKMDDVLPFMPIPPLAFTNPVFLARPGSPNPH
jgi:hypothetical protein